MKNKIIYFLYEIVDFNCEKYISIYSALDAPLVPVLKLSINLTVLRSNGTVVPPDVTTATGLFPL